MVEFQQNLDSNQKIFVPRAVKYLFDPTVVIKPNKFSGAIYPVGTPPELVISSLKVIIHDLQNEIDWQHKIIEDFYKELKRVAQFFETQPDLKQKYGGWIPIKYLPALISKMTVDDINIQLHMLSREGKIHFNDDRTMIRLEG